MYSGHPLGLFPSNKNSPVVVTNGLTIPNYSSQNDYEIMNALGVTQYGQMTASMYIGLQGIVQDYTYNPQWLQENILILIQKMVWDDLVLEVCRGTKPSTITGAVSVIAESIFAAIKRHEQVGYQNYTMI